MKNYVQGDGTVIIPAPYDCLSGDFIAVGSLYGVVVNDTLNGVDAVVKREGVYNLPKAAGVAWTRGDQLYWDAAAKNFTKTAAGNRAVGICFTDALNADTFGDVLIDEVPAGILNAIAGVGAGYKIARGQATTVTAADTIVTGLASVVAAVAVLEDAPVLTCMSAQAVIGDQAGAPAAGSIIVKTWKPTASGDVTPLAASAFGKKVNWIAVGI